MSEKRQNRVLFLSVPESLRGQIESMSSENSVSGDDFSINPDIPLPIEISGDKEDFNLDELSWEMIIAGMLSVIAAGPNALAPAQMSDAQMNDWFNYYRCFILAVRPSIMSEFTEAAILKARNGDFGLALEIFNSLRGLFPFSPAVMLNRALVMEERAAALERRNSAEAADAFRAAEAAYAEALTIGSERNAGSERDAGSERGTASEGGAGSYSPFPEAQFNAGFFYLGRKDFHRARECFSRYVTIAEDTIKIEQAESIIKDIDESGLEDESFTNAYKLIQQGNEEKGMQSIRDFIEKYPSVWNGWFVLGWALRRLGRWEDGAVAFCKAIDLGGSNSDTRNELAICMMESGDLKGARHELESALCDDPENVKIISNLGVLALKSGNNDEAAAFFRTVLEIDPEDPIAQNFFANR
ncbi:MAG: tetratricopeptide repeat protein [Treponema sp.]|jgi:tetratricopeptide (TPR) repeat protein|nr:tetratricopeptide repeat protein [Treponema sp.]